MVVVVGVAALADVVTDEGVVEYVVVSDTDIVVESAVVISTVVDEAGIIVAVTESNVVWGDVGEPGVVVFSRGGAIVDGVDSEVVAETVVVDHDVVVTTGVVVNGDVVVSDDNVVLGVSANK